MTKHFSAELNEPAGALVRHDACEDASGAPEPTNIVSNFSEHAPDSASLEPRSYLARIRDRSDAGMGSIASNATAGSSLPKARARCEWASGAIARLKRVTRGRM